MAEHIGLARQWTWPRSPATTASAASARTRHYPRKAYKSAGPMTSPGLQKPALRAYLEYTDGVRYRDAYPSVSSHSLAVQSQDPRFAVVIPAACQ